MSPTAEHAGIDMGSTCFQGAVPIGSQQLQHGTEAAEKLTRWRCCSPCRCGSVSRYRRLCTSVREAHQSNSSRHTNNASQRPDKLFDSVSMVSVGLEGPRSQCGTYVVDLSGSSAADGISNTHTVHSHLVDRPVQRQEVNQVGPEGVFARDC
jgi:hypothetical protein